MFKYKYIQSLRGLKKPILQKWCIITDHKNQFKEYIFTPQLLPSNLECIGWKKFHYAGNKSPPYPRQFSLRSIKPTTPVLPWIIKHRFWRLSRLPQESSRLMDSCIKHGGRGRECYPDHVTDSLAAVRETRIRSLIQSSRSWEVKWEVPCRRDSSCQFLERRSSSWRRDSCRDSSGMAFEIDETEYKNTLYCLFAILSSFLKRARRHWARQIQILEQGDKRLSFVIVVPGLWFVFQRKSWNFSKGCL